MKKTAVLSGLLMFLFSYGRIGAAEWYKSSPGGVPEERLLEDDDRIQGWVLSIEKSIPETEVFNDGENLEESLESQENINSDTNSENVETHTLFHNGTVQSSTRYVRKDGVLLSLERRDALGKTMERVEYVYDSQGSLRNVYIWEDGTQAAPGGVEIDSIKNPDESVWRHVSGSGGNWSILDKNPGGSDRTQKILKDGLLSEEKNWKWNDENVLEEEIIRTGDDVLTRFFDKEGQVVKEVKSRQGDIILERTSTWEDGNLIRIEEQGGTNLIIREYEWLGDRKIREVEKVDGQIVSQTDWQEDDNKTETLFSNGKAFIKVYWLGNQILKKEYLR